MLMNLRPLAVTLFSAAVLLAQPQTFDAYTYDAPPGYTAHPRKDSVEWVKIDNARRFYCQISLYRAQPTLGSAIQDIDSEWKAVVIKQFRVQGSPSSRGLSLPNAPDSILRSAESIDDKGNKALNSLFAVRFPGRYVGVLFNSPNQEAFQACQDDVNRVAGSVRFPAVGVPPPSTGSGGVIGIWERVIDTTNPVRYNSAAKPFGEFSAQGLYNRWRSVYRFRFEGNGQYTFELDAEDHNNNQRRLTVERGMYSIAAGSIQFQPKEVREGQGPRGQNPALTPRAVPAAHARGYFIGQHPVHTLAVNSNGLQLRLGDGGWETYVAASKPAP